MPKNARIYRRIVMPLALALFLVLLCASSVFASTARASHLTLIGPKSHYLALGGSLAFGYQPDLDFSHGYVDDFYGNLQSHGTNSLANMACSGETSVTFLNGNCPYSYLRKFPYIGSQLNAALFYLSLYRGQVSPVTLSIGANDVKQDINLKTCAINTQKLASDLTTLDNNLRQTILPKLHAALLVKGQLSGDLLLMNYYDPYQNICPNSVSFTQDINQHLAADVKGYGTIVDVFTAFGGATTPNANICIYTWMCSIFHDIHGTTKGYSVIATAFENGTGY